MRWAVLLALLSAGCVCLPILGGPPPRDDERPPVVNWDGLADVRGIVHCHSKLSHDSHGEFEDIADAANETSCSFVAFTDHLAGRDVVRDEPDGVVNGVLLIPGAELNMNGGSLLSLGVAAGLDPHVAPDVLIARIRALGGVAAIGHPEEWHLCNVADVDGCELENFHADVRDECYFSLALRAIFFPPRPFFSSILDRQDRAAAVYDALARQRPLAAIGSCDAHETIHPLGPLAGAVDSYRRLFRTVNTHVLVPKTGRELAKSDVLLAFKLGRTYAASELTQDATGFRFTATWAAGTVTLGGVAPLASGLALEVNVPAPGTISILRDGAEVWAEEGTRARFEPTVRGAYRVEVAHRDKPWIWSSAIRIN